jgi:transposase-like protein
MVRRKRRSFSEGEKAAAVEYVETSGKHVSGR